ncbi:prolipoprotein diacylglyceryl transferase family protein [Tunturiibacter gelidiferens]|uniref:prolipoprotein diacylglyceryl transferase family protein n=1 Tax=Tunturiibacter gelidiferens TaxID=3069689 RepID=UPI003D9AEF65
MPFGDQNNHTKTAATKQTAPSPVIIKNVHPYLLHSGHLILPTFGVLAALGLMAALTLSLRTAAIVGLDPDKLWNAGLFTLLTAFALSRILLIATNLHNFLVYPILLLTVPSLTPTGILLTLLAALIYLRIRHLPLLDILDAWSPCAALIWAFLALGHFAEGSDAGLPTTLPWGIRIPPDRIHLHPVPLYAAIAAAILTLILLQQLRNRRQPGDTLFVALAAAGTLQFLLTFFRQPYPYTSSATYVLLDPIQWIALGMIVVAAVILLLPRKLVTHAV